MNRPLRAFVPLLLLLLTLVTMYVMPSYDDIKPSAISPDLPLDYDLEGWYGRRTQESAAERQALSGDTVFSKGVYVLRRDSEEELNPPVNVSIVYSGNDMNNSIHHPERCLPAQGHLNLKGSMRSLKLADGHEITFTRLSSTKLIKGSSGRFTNHVHYYIFIGHSSIQSTHWDRTLRDMYDRVVGGYVQRWAYLQVGSHWGGDSPFTEEQCEEHIIRLISELLPRLVDWKAVGM